MKTKTKRKPGISLVPDYVFDTYRDVTPEFLTSLGIRALLIDIDNTLAPYEQELPDENIIAWFKALQENDIRAALISNNEPGRVELFNSLLSVQQAYVHLVGRVQVHRNVDKIFIKERHAAFYAPRHKRFVCAQAVVKMKLAHFAHKLFVKLLSVWCFMKVQVAAKKLVAALARKHHLYSH